MKTKAPLVVTLVLVAVGFGLLVSKDSTPKATAEKPEEILYEMFEAAKSGQVRKYLKCFGPELRVELEQRQRDQGKSAFRQYLIDWCQPVKGIALSDKAFEDDRGSVKVEWVFGDHNEEQVATLRKLNGAWRITGLTEGQRREQLVPYGTPAYPMDTESKDSDTGAAAEAGDSRAAER